MLGHPSWLVPDNGVAPVADLAKLYDSDRVYVPWQHKRAKAVYRGCCYLTVNPLAMPRPVSERCANQAGNGKPPKTSKL